MRQFHPAIFCLIIAIVGFVLSGCSVKTTRTVVTPETIVGRTMEEVIEMEGEPAGRTSDQLIYRLYTTTKVDPYWAYILLMGIGGGVSTHNSAVSLWDMEMTERNYYCITLNFEDNVLVSHTTTELKKGESC